MEPTETNNARGVSTKKITTSFPPHGSERTLQPGRKCSLVPTNARVETRSNFFMS